jgi:hypothetical protein
MAHCKPKKMKFGGAASRSTSPRPKLRPGSGLKSSPRPKLRPGSISKESLIGSMTKDDVLDAIDKGKNPKDIGRMPSGSTRGVDPKDNYSAKDLMRLIGSVVSPAGGLSKAAVKAGKAASNAGRAVSGMEDGGLVGGQHKLDKNKDGKISGADFKMMKYGGKVTKMRNGGKVGGCRGGGAAVAGTKFTGCK